MMKPSVHHPPKIIICGAPASGKGTQCEFIKVEYGVVHLSTGDILRAAAAAGTEMGLKAKTFMDSGKLVPDEVMIGLILDRLKESDCIERGWLLDGFPRTGGQANALTEAGIHPDVFIQLDVDDAALVERVVGRRMDPSTGKIYHLKYSPPPPELAGKLIHRSDDTEEKVAVRIATYHSNLAAIAGKYSHCNVTVNGNRHPKKIWEDIKCRIQKKFQFEVVIVLGGPGCGKGTLCSRVCSEFGYTHLSAGDLLREEQQTESEASRLIKNCIVQGTIVPARITVGLLHQAMERSFASPSASRKFLIDGFPRNMDNVKAWYEEMGNISTIDFVLNLECSEEVMRERLLKRSATSGRSDDNEETIMKRFITFNTDTKPVFASYDRLGKLRIIDASLTPNVVYQQASNLLKSLDILPPYERTLALIKPDAVARGCVPEIQRMIRESSNLSIIFSKLVTLNDECIDFFYAEHKGKPFYPGLKGFMKSAPTLVMILEGRDAIRAWRTLMGPTNTVEALSIAPESVRAKFGTDGTRNAVHGSDSEWSAMREIDFWFDPASPGASASLLSESPETDLSSGGGGGGSSSSSTSSGSGSSSVSLSLGGLPVSDTYAMIKPLTAQTHYEELLSLIAAHGFEIVSEVRSQLTPSQAEGFYAEHKGKEFYPSLVAYMTSRKIVGLHLRRPAAVAAWRHLIGPTNPIKAREDRPDCVRSLFALDGTRNAVHGSDSKESAIRELNFIFNIGGVPPFPIQAALLRPPNNQLSSGISTTTASFSPVKNPTLPPLFNGDKPTAKRLEPNAGRVNRTEVSLMQGYAAQEVDPVMRLLLQRLMIARPPDVANFAIKELANIKAERHRSLGGKLEPIHHGGGGGGGMGGGSTVDGGGSMATLGGDENDSLM